MSLPQSHSFSCNPCGRGTRCMFCTWLVGFCNIHDSNQTDMVTLPYKQPYIEMFEDIKMGIIAGDFSPTAVSEFFELSSGIFFKECKDCDSIAIREAALMAEKSAKRVRAESESNSDPESVKAASIEATDQLLEKLKAISNATQAFVDKQSYNTFFSR